MKINELIVTPVTTCTIESDVAHVRDLMTLKNISAIPVMKIEDDNASVEGIVTYQDLAGVYDDTIKVKQVMSRTLFAVDPEISVQKAAQIMIDKKIHHLIAMKGDELVGILSTMDFVKIVAEG